MRPPRLLTAADLALRFRDVFGPLGPVRQVTGHFSAGPRAGNWGQATDVARRLHVEHLHMGWGGCGYHFLIADDGTLLCLRPVALQGAHVGGHNAGNVGVLCAGTSGHRPTRAQRETYAWLLRSAHTSALPPGHRLPEDLREAESMVHNLWHGHSTNPCAGSFTEMFLAGVDQPTSGLAVDPPDEQRVVSAGYPPATDFRGIVADARHVSVLEAHRAAACQDRDDRAGLPHDDLASRRTRGPALALAPAR